MPPPPPPPPGPGGQRGPLAPRPAAPKGGGGDRDALLSAIRTGANLKKAVTNDRSAPLIDGKSKPSTNGAGGGGGGGGGGGMGMMNGGAPQLAGLFAGGMPKLKPTGKGIPTSPANKSGPLMPPGRKPAPSVPVRETSLDTQSNTSDNNSIPPSPKPSSKSNPAPPPPPPSTLKPSLPSERPSRGPVPVPPNPANKPAPPRPPMDDRPAPPSPESGFHPALPSKPVVVKPSVGNKPAPPRPPNGTKPTLPPKITLQPNGDPLSSNKPATRTESMKEYRSTSRFQNHNHSAEENLAPSRTLPPSHHHKNSPGTTHVRPSTVGRYMGGKIMHTMARPPSERPPPPPSRPSVPPPSQPPPPPPSRTAQQASSKPEPPVTAPPPPPPNRVSSRQSGDFESKFQFHTLSQFPLPITYMNCTKTYPSKNGKSTKRPGVNAPPPPSSLPNNKPSPPAHTSTIPPHPSPSFTTPFSSSSTLIPPPPPLSLPSGHQNFPNQPLTFAKNPHIRRGGGRPGQGIRIGDGTQHASEV